jgi:hypothetical protein
MAEDNIAPSFMKGKTEADSSTGDRLYDTKQIRGTRTSFNENNDYRVENLMYPSDLLSTAASSTSKKYKNTANNEYGSNYVIFYINVNESSKLLKNQDSWYGNKTVGDYTQPESERIVGKKISTEQAGVASGIEGAIAGGGLTGNFKGAGAGGAIGFIGTEVIGTQTASFTKQMKRLQTAIALHTPNNLTARYGTNWEETNTNMFQLAMRGGESLGKAMVEGYDKQNVSDETKENLKSMGAAIALNTVPGKDAISAITGLAVNPKKEQLFRGVDFRTWSFDYQFFPKSKEELINVQNIIYLFKLHMHPEYKDANNFLYLYPSEFDIVHYNGVDENFNLPRHTSCVLTELVVNYAPQSQFTSFAEGAPTQINITMSFKELVQMSKERIMEGF